MTAEKPGNKASIQLFAGHAVADHQLVSSSDPTCTLAAVKTATKASTQLSAGQLVTEEAAVAASCAYHSPAIWKPSELHSKGDLILKTLKFMYCMYFLVCMRFQANSWIRKQSVFFEKWISVILTDLFQRIFLNVLSSVVDP
jgi:hypothetical protein